MSSLRLCDRLLVAAAVATLFTSAYSQNCTSNVLRGGRTYDNCDKLPKLGAYLHWSYSKANASLSLAFSVKPLESANSWASWGYNLNGTGMLQAEVLIASNINGTLTVSQYMLESYRNIVKRNLSLQVSRIAAQQLDGEISIFADVKLEPYMANGSSLNHIWQVGRIKNGTLSIHDLKDDNKNAKGTLNLTGGGGQRSNSAAFFLFVTFCNLSTFLILFMFT